MARKVMFQRWRIFWWAMKMAGRSGANKESNPALSAAYRELAELGKLALLACRDGRQDAFLANLDGLDATDKQLARWLDGKGDDLPEWLRKD